ncbi:hypothetical protein [Streptomyces dysideae]|uniref:Uncharacterized protein n=1 Tax=Streptomyces dysideae TaxID=909626 RepID=A0A101V012_9ACTN|nr:hypothetical protein [Streptomyces dysideae]KUO19977.1 hypothetical protein AQJ91_16820 [Streptomyces dysideae]
MGDLQGGGNNGVGADGEDGAPSGSKTVTGPNGQKLTVTPVNNLATEDQTLKVTGSGYDAKKGIYVALRVDNGDGELPTPCVGGVGMSGGSHSSAWISSNPPDYGEDLAVPYDAGGTFEVELTVDAKDEYTDCFKATCVLATRNDHGRWQHRRHGYRLHHRRLRHLGHDRHRQRQPRLHRRDRALRRRARGRPAGRGLGGVPPRPLGQLRPFTAEFALRRATSAPEGDAFHRRWVRGRPRPRCTASRASVWS